MLEVNSENFDLSEANRFEIDERMEKVKSFLGEGDNIHLFISKEGGDNFKFVIRVRHYRKDIIAEAHNKDFHFGLKDVKHKIIKNLVEHKEKLFKLNRAI